MAITRRRAFCPAWSSSGKRISDVTRSSQINHGLTGRCVSGVPCQPADAVNFCRARFRNSLCCFAPSLTFRIRHYHPFRAPTVSTQACLPRGAIRRARNCSCALERFVGCSCLDLSLCRGFEMCNCFSSVRLVHYICLLSAACISRVCRCDYCFLLARIASSAPHARAACGQQRDFPNLWRYVAQQSAHLRARLSCAISSGNASGSRSICLLRPVQLLLFTH